MTGRKGAEDHNAKCGMGHADTNDFGEWCPATWYGSKLGDMMMLCRRIFDLRLKLLEES